MWRIIGQIVIRSYQLKNEDRVFENNYNYYIVDLNLEWENMSEMQNNYLSSNHSNSIIMDIFLIDKDI